MYIFILRFLYILELCDYTKLYIYLCSTCYFLPTSCIARSGSRVLYLLKIVQWDMMVQHPVLVLYCVIVVCIAREEWFCGTGTSAFEFSIMPSNIFIFRHWTRCVKVAFSQMVRKRKDNYFIFSLLKQKYKKMKFYFLVILFVY